jgi:hypothetical protein
MLQLNVSYGQKRTDGNYGSNSAGCSLTIELDSALLADPASLQQHIKSAYQIVALAVERQLQAPDQAEVAPPAVPATPALKIAAPHPTGPSRFPEEPAAPPARPTGRGSRGGRVPAQVRKPHEPVPNLPPAPRADGSDLQGREPRTGHELLGWLSSQTKLHGKEWGEGLYQDAFEAGRRLGYGDFFKAWTPEQVHTVYSLIRPSTAAANGTTH